METDAHGGKRAIWQVKQKDGTWTEGRMFPIQAKLRYKNVGAIHPEMPTNVVVPNEVYNHIKPLLDDYAPDKWDRFFENAVGNTISGYTSGIAEKVLHTVSRGSIIARAKQKAQNLPGMDQSAKAKLAQDFINAGVMARSMGEEFLALTRPFAERQTPGGAAARAALKATGQRGFTPEERLEAVRFAAKTGVIPPDFPNMQPGLLKSGSRFMAGENGLIANAVTAIYSHFKQHGALETPEGRLILRDALRELNTHGKTQQSTFGKALRSVGLGTFYQTGMKNRTAAVANGPRAAMAGIVGSVLFHIALFKLSDEKHRWPWQVPNARLGDLYLPLHDSDGKQIRISTDILDRTGAYAEAPLRTAMQATGQRQGTTQRNINVAGELVNQIPIRPAWSGPAPAFLEQLMGAYPQVRAGESVLPPSFMSPTPTGKLSYLDPRRVRQTIFAFNPFTQAFGEQVSGETPQQPQSPYLRGANIVASALGFPQLRTETNEAKILKAVRNKEQAYRKAQRKR